MAIEAPRTEKGIQILDRVERIFKLPRIEPTAVTHERVITQGLMNMNNPVEPVGKSDSQSAAGAVDLQTHLGFMDLRVARSQFGPRTTATLINSQLKVMHDIDFRGASTEEVIRRLNEGINARLMACETGIISVR